MSPPTISVIENIDSVTLQFVIATDSDGITFRNPQATFVLMREDETTSPVTFTSTPDFPHLYELELSPVALSDAGTYTARVPSKIITSIM